MSKTIRAIGLLLACAAVAALALWLIRGGGGGARLGAPPADSNVLLITVDTLRADRVGAYGYSKAGTPNMDGLAARGVLFENTVTPVPLTLPSHASIMSGLYPPSHGVRNNGLYSLPGNVPTLAALLKERGFRTSAFVSAFVLDARFGLDQGFDHYSDEVNEALPGSWYAERNADEVLADFLDWFRGREKGRFFSWIHFWDPHMEYDPPEPYRSRFDDPYDGEIAFVDSAIGRILDVLKAEGLTDRTMVILTADHGEAFGEHGELGHSIFCYEENIRVPLIMSFPGVLPAALRSQERASLVDLMPTVLDLLGFAPPGPGDGLSLLPAIRGGRLAKRDFYLESLYALEDMGAAPVVGLITGRYKFLDLPRAELYDTEKDPFERENLIARDPARAEDMKEALSRQAEALASADRSSRRTVTNEEWSKLASLGYLSNARPSAKAEDLPDPKDVVGSAAEIVRGKRATADGRVGEATRCFERAIALHPQNLTAYLLLSELHNRIGAKEEAVAVLLKGMDVNPRDHRLRYRLGLLHIQQGDLERGLAELLTVERAGDYPDPARLYEAIGIAYQNLGREEDALANYRKFIEIDGDDRGMGRTRAGLLLLKIGHPEEALRLLEGIDPAKIDEVRTAHTLAVTFARLGRFERAEAFFRKSMDFSGFPANVLYNFALMKNESGQRAAALSLMKDFLARASADNPLRPEAARLAEEWAR